LTNNPDSREIETWNSKEEFNVLYETMQILFDHGVKSPWAK